MSKKLISLILSLAMLLGVALVTLTSCAEENVDDKQEDIANSDAGTARTLTMYIMSENVTTDLEAEAEAKKQYNKLKKDNPNTNMTLADVLEQIDPSAAAAYKLEKAISAITEERIKTRVEIYFYPEDVYYSKLEASIDKQKSVAAGGSYEVEVDKENNDPVFNKDTGMLEIKYPAIPDYQVDLFYLGGEDKFNEYKSKGYFSTLDGEIDYASKVLKTCIAEQLYSNIKKLNNNITYALPTNSVIGEYTYLLLNKQALNDAYRRNENGSNDFSAYTSLTNSEVKQFLADVANTSGGLSEKYYPLYTNLDKEELLISNLQFWGVDEEGELDDAFSVLGGYYANSGDFGDNGAYAAMENLFENKQFINDITTLKSYELNNYYKAVEGKDFAVGYVKGGAELVEEYGDKYEMIVLESPRLDEEELYEDLFAVSANTSSLERTTDLLILFNTDTQLRNLLLYGIEGEHYQLVDTEIDNKYGERIMTVKRHEKGKSYYMMSESKTGSVFTAYPLDGTLLTLKDYGVKQNSEAKVKLSLGFKLEGADVEKLKEIKTLSDTLFAEYLACKSETELESFITSAQTRVKESEAVQYHLKDSQGSLTYDYNSWLKTNNIK